MSKLLSMTFFQATDSPAALPSTNSSGGLEPSRKIDMPIRRFENRLAGVRVQNLDSERRLPKGRIAEDFPAALGASRLRGSVLG